MTKDDTDLFGIETRYRRIETERLTGDDYETSLDPPDGSAPDNMEPAFKLIAAMFGEGTAAELDAESVLYNIVGAFNRPLIQLHRAHGEACSTLRDLVDRGDSSEVGSVRLEQAERRAHLLDQRIEHLEAIRDIAIRCYEDAVGRAWTPPKGSAPSRSGQTASARSARQYLAASRARELAALAPEGERFAVMGAPEVTDETLITRALDDVRDQYPDMILVHTADRNNPVDNAAARWARRNNIHQIPMDQPDFTRHKSAAPFIRNDEMIALGLTGVIIVPRPEGAKPHGISENLAQKATEARPKVPVRRIKA
ncbi:MAG: DUF2493 domain-containing protein [Alphaproteobacteria bacterium]